MADRDQGGDMADRGWGHGSWLIEQGGDMDHG